MASSPRQVCPGIEIVLVRNPFIPLLLAAIAAILSGLVAVTGLINLDLYRSTTPPHLIPGTVSQDIGTVLVSIGVLVLTVVLRQGRDHLWFVWLGGVGYLAYGYAIFVFEAVLNPLYPAYVAILSLSLWSVIAFFARLQAGAARAIDPPRRFTAVLFIFLACLFALLWSTILGPAIIVRERPDGLTIILLDFVFVLPLIVLSAILLLKRAPFGDILAIPVLIKASSIGLSVLLGTLLSPLFGLPASVGELAIYALLGIGPLLLLRNWIRATTVDCRND